MVQDIKSFGNELQLDALTNIDLPGHARIERDDSWHVESVASEARDTFRTAVAVVVEVCIDQRAVRFSALGVEDEGDLPPLSQSLDEAIAYVFGVVEVPDAIENEAMANVVVAVGPVEAQVVGIIGQLAVVGAGHYRGGVGSIVDHVAPGVRRGHLEIV